MENKRSRRKAREEVEKQVAAERKNAEINEISKTIIKLKNQLELAYRKLDEALGITDIEDRTQSSEEILGRPIRAYPGDSEQDAILARMNFKRQLMQMQQEIDARRTSAGNTRSSDAPKKRNSKKKDLSSDEESEVFSDSSSSKVKLYEESDNSNVGSDEEPQKPTRSAKQELSKLSSKRSKPTRRATPL